METCVDRSVRRKTRLLYILNSHQLQITFINDTRALKNKFNHGEKNVACCYLILIRIGMKPCSRSGLIFTYFAFGFSHFNHIFVGGCFRRIRFFLVQDFNFFFGCLAKGFRQITQFSAVNLYVIFMHLMYLFPSKFCPFLLIYAEMNNEHVRCAQKPISILL